MNPTGPAIDAAALKLGIPYADAAEGIAAFLEHMDEYYVGDMYLEQSLGYLQTMVAEVR